MKQEKLSRKIRRTIGEKINNFASDVWIHDYVQQILAGKVGRIQTQDAELVKQIITWADTKEPIGLFISMCEKAGISSDVPIYLKSFTTEIGCIVITANVNGDEDKPYLIELEYSGELLEERKLSIKTEKEKTTVYNYPVTKFSAEYNDGFRLILSVESNNLNISVLNEDSTTMTIKIFGVKRKGLTFLEIYKKVKQMLDVYEVNIFAGNLKLSEIIKFYKTLYNIENVDVLYSGKTVKLTDSHLASYKDNQEIEIVMKDSENVERYKCPLDNGVIVELKDEKYNVLNVSQKNKQDIASFVEEADKVVNFIIAENQC